MTGDTPELRDRLRGYVQAWRDAGEPGDAADYVAKEYLASYVNTVNLLRDEQTRGATFNHMLNRIAERYRDTYKPSGLEWNMGEARAVKEFVGKVVSEIRRSA